MLTQTTNPTNSLIVRKLNKDINKLLSKLWNRPPQTTLGIEKVVYIDSNKGEAEVQYSATKEMCHSGGIVQGGFVTAWIDATMALACMAKCGIDVLVLTLEIKISFLSSAKVGKLISKGKVVKTSRSIAFLEGQLEDLEGNIIAKGTCTAKLKPNFYKY